MLMTVTQVVMCLIVQCLGSQKAGALSKMRAALMPFRVVVLPFLDVMRVQYINILSYVLFV